jgi:hypothetical protein
MRKQALFLISIAALFSASPSVAQETSENASVSYLMQKYSLSRSEAETRIAVQGEVIALSERLNAEGDPQYGDMFIQHAPQFKIVILFADKNDRKAFLDSLDPKLRRYVQLKQAKKSRGVFSRELEELSAALNASKIAYTAKYDLETERYVVTLATESDATRVRAILPDTRKVETDVKVAPLPGVQATPTGVQSGDRLYAGNPLFAGALPAGTTDATIRRSDLADCTLGFAVAYTKNSVAKRGLLTSGHCANTMVVKFGDRYVTLSGPDEEKRHRDATRGGDGVSDKWDYQIFDITGITVDNQIAYFDENNIPEFPDNGIHRLTAITGYYNQKQGMVVCKSGGNTGITCGTISNGALTYDGALGWIEVSGTNQAVISVGGDSGSGWYLYPGTSSSVTGVGLHTAGNAVPGASGIAVYMPIDYIDDHNTTVNTIKQ